MARPRNHAKHLSVAVQGLVESLTGLSRMIAAAAARPVPARAPAPGSRGPGKNNPKLKAALKASWARLSAAERSARVQRMRAGRGRKAKRGARARARART